jgi:hypothetical protein
MVRMRIWLEKICTNCKTLIDNKLFVKEHIEIAQSICRTKENILAVTTVIFVFVFGIAEAVGWFFGRRRF